MKNHLIRSLYGMRVDRSAQRADDAGNPFLWRLLEILLPNGRGYAAMMEAYFDESGTHAGAPGLCVAGYLFEAERCRSFDRELATMLDAVGVKVFHATDRAARQGEFAGKSRGECDALLKDMVGLIKKYASFGVAVLVSEADFDRLAPDRWRETAGGPYTACVQFGMAAIGKWVRHNAPAERVAYFFEKGHPSDGEANAYLKKLEKDPVLSEECRYEDAAFVGKRSMRPLQAADLLAWELNKLRTDRLLPKPRAPRKSLRALAEQFDATVFDLQEKHLLKLFADTIKHNRGSS